MASPCGIPVHPEGGEGEGGRPSTAAIIGHDITVKVYSIRHKKKKKMDYLME
jgi:hypothetical protein